MVLQGKTLDIPIIQGGMGVGISLSRLAGNVAKCGGMGVISSVNAGYQEADFYTNTLKANLRALHKHIVKAKEIACGRGMVAVNIMCAVNHYEETVKCAIDAGADAIISGAGLPLHLREYTKGTDTLCAPIVSSGKAASILCRKYLKTTGELPDFFVMEGYKAGGHLELSKKELEEHIAKNNDEILKDILNVLSIYENDEKEIPVFVAGGVYDGGDMAHYMKEGASGVQIATRFIATKECDASEGFKKVIIDAREEDIILIESPVGMTARAVDSPLLRRLRQGSKYQALQCNNCLQTCKKGDLTPYCISRALIEAVNGNYEDGLFFCGENAYRVKEITTVEALMAQIEKEWRMHV